MSTVSRAAPVAAKPRYHSPSREKYVDVGLDEFEDDEIRKEHEHRLGKKSSAITTTEEDSVSVPEVELRKVRALLLSGRTSDAAWAMQDLIRDALGTAL